MTCKDKTNLAHLHITQIISSCLSGRLKFRLSWPISTHMHASVPHPFSSQALCSIHLSFFSSGWNIVCFQRQSTFSLCSDWLILRQVEGHVQRSWPPGECHVWGLLSGSICVIFIFFVETCRCKNSLGFMPRLKHFVGMFMSLCDFLNFFCEMGA